LGICCPVDWGSSVPVFEVTRSQGSVQEWLSRQKGEQEMYKKIVFVTLVILIASAVASAGFRRSYSHSPSIKQSQSTYVYGTGGTAAQITLGRLQTAGPAIVSILGRRSAECPDRGHC